MSRTTHKASKFPEYVAWADMKQRCFNNKNKRYKDYGGRGITVCQNWIYSFEEFYKDMGKKPEKRYSIERIDNDGNYCANNCKWATKEEQYNNRRTNKKIYYNGQNLTITQWAKKLGMHPTSLFSRLKIMSEIETVSTPYKSKYKSCGVKS